MKQDPFDVIKTQILHNLYNGIDYSPKGSIDYQILDLVHMINKHPHYVTTSSCSGRICIAYPLSDDKGVHWILAKHATITKEEILNSLETLSQENDVPTNQLPKLISLKCEPFIMHLCCRDVESAKSLYQLAMDCGFRESGMSLGSKKIMIAIRTTSFALDLPIARDQNLLIDSSYLDLIIQMANTKLLKNFARIQRLLTQFKKHFQWPLYSSPMTSIKNINGVSNTDSYLLDRWGHSVCQIVSPTETNHNASYLIFGGIGVEEAKHLNSSSSSSSSSLKSGKNVQAYLFHEENYQYEIIPSINQTIPSTSFSILQNIQLEKSQGHLLLISGGRTSPTQPFPCLRSYHIQSLKKDSFCSSVELIESGDIPSPRWGHSFHPLIIPTSKPSDSRWIASYILFGGRDSNQIFSDFYEVSLCWDGDLVALEGSNDAIVSLPKLICTWKLLPMNLPRCFHASCMVIKPLSFDESIVDVMLVHGGISSISDPYPQSDFHLVNFSTNEIQSIVVSSIDNETDNLDFMKLNRMGHNLILLPGQSILLMGGVSSQDESSLEENSKYSINQTYTLNYSFPFSENSSPFNQSIGLELTIESSSSLNNTLILPDQQCRVHSQVIYNIYSDSLLVLGGGLMSLAFGNHYCQSLVSKIGFQATEYPLFNQNEKSLETTKSTKGEPPAKLKSISTKSAQIDGSLNVIKSPGLIVSQRYVKAMKTFLEQNKYLNKETRIRNLILPSEPLNETIYQLQKDSNGQFQPNVINDLNQISVEGVSMVIPITESFMNLILNSSSLLPETWTALINSIDSSLFLVTNHWLFINSLSSSPLTLPHELAATQSLRSFNFTVFSQWKQQLSGEKLANAFLLEAIIPIFKLPEECKNNIPSKYEFVGDILMIPEQAFTSNAWVQWIQHHSPYYLEDSETNEEYFWKLLAQCFKLARVAKKAIIDPNDPMRKSQVILFYNNGNSLKYIPKETQVSTDDIQTKVANIPAKEFIMSEEQSELVRSDYDPKTTFPKDIPGWVSVVDNGIKYSFDITQVMFSSGNITEKMRMAKQSVKGETIVDLYCGIGYYTIPLLVYGKAKQVYACEWNPFSVAALKQNLISANIQPSQCIIYEGDNRITTEHLIDIADRVMLGLLPTSTPGWPAAVRALKPEGGIFHLHENVHEKHIQEFVRTTIERLCSMFAEKNKPMNIELLHLEKVKSYAPRVFHYVLDLKITQK